MPGEAEPSLNERAFVLQALQENVRSDGRALDAYRPIEISFGDEFGVADVQLGKTRVLARISASVTAPHPDRKFDGIFTISTELSPLASPAFEVGRSSFLESTLTHLLDLTLRRSSAIPTESLCLLASRAVWSLLLTMHVLAHDGSLLTAASIAALAALAHFRLPATSVRGEEVTVFKAREREPAPLSLLHWPLCVSVWGVGAGEERNLNGDDGDGEERVATLLLDATLSEERVCSGEVVVAANEQGEVCLVHKSGGAPADALMLLQCVDVAVQKVAELGKTIKGALERDAQRRDPGGMEAELQATNER